MQLVNALGQCSWSVQLVKCSWLNAVGQCKISCGRIQTLMQRQNDLPPRDEFRYSRQATVLVVSLAIFVDIVLELF